MPSIPDPKKLPRNRRPKLYVIHGWTYTVAPWERTISLLEKQGLVVEMLNVPGLTTSSKKVWTIDEYKDWADRNIPNGAIALGHSNGGRILLNLCSEKPDKLSHLILLDSAGVYEVSNKRDVARNLSKKLGFLKKIPGLTRVWHKMIGASDYARAPENMKKTLANMLDSDKSLNIARVTTPTSILWGANDTVTPPHQAEIIHQSIKDSTLKIFPGWSHAPYISHPDELAKAILQAYRHPPEVKTPVEVTQAATVSASMAMKKAAEPVVPSTAPISATLAFKKAAGPSADDTSKMSAALAVPSSRSKPIATHSGAPLELQPAAHFRSPLTRRQRAAIKRQYKASAPQPATPSTSERPEGVEYEVSDFATPEPRQIISSASVPKVSRFERARRKIGRKPKLATHKSAQKSATKPARSTAITGPSNSVTAKSSNPATKSSAAQSASQRGKQ